jgi:putative membrane protein
MMRSVFLAGACLLFAACSSEPEPTADTDTVVQEDATMMDNPAVAPSGDASGTTDAVALPTDAAGYVAAAGAGDRWEIESSRALLQKSTDAEVKKFAQMMIDQHQLSTKKVMAAAEGVNVGPTPPPLNTDQQGSLNEIRDAQAADVDAVYLRHQRAAHALALSTHRGFAQGGDNPALKRAAAEIVPVIERHIAEIDRLSRRVPATAG